MSHTITVAQPVPVVVGVDTHADEHEAAVLDTTGRMLAHHRFRGQGAPGKNDIIDAEQAARKVLSGQASGIATDTTGLVEAIRQIKVTRYSASFPSPIRRR